MVVVRCNEGDEDLGELVVVEVDNVGVGRNLSSRSGTNPRVIGGRRLDSCFLDRVVDDDDFDPGGEVTAEVEAEDLDDSPNLG